MFPRPFKAVLLAALCLPAVQAAAAEITLYEHDNFHGRELTLREATPDLVRYDFNDRTSSIIVHSGAWEVCVDGGFRGCRVFEPGQYQRMNGLNDQISSVRQVGRDRDRGARAGRRDRDAGLHLFTSPNLRGRSESINRDLSDFTLIGFNDRTQGIRVEGGSWELCSDAGFRGTCRTYGPGVHQNLGRGLAGRVSSARRVDRFDRDGRDDGYYQPPYGGPGGPGSGRPAVELFTGQGFTGSAIALNRDVQTMAEFNFNDRARSIVVNEGEWRFCEHEGMGGQCVVFGPGRYDRLGSLDRALTSLRRLR